PPPTRAPSTLSLHDALPISIARTTSAAISGGNGPADLDKTKQSRANINSNASHALVAAPRSSFATKCMNKVNSVITQNELRPFLDRKSTRLNSSHRTISYAV